MRCSISLASSRNIPATTWLQGVRHSTCESCVLAEPYCVRLDIQILDSVAHSLTCDPQRSRNDKGRELSGW